MEEPDEILLLTAHRNSLTALSSGVTTIRDCGGKGRLMFHLRDAITRGIVPGPRFVLSGRPLTITGGHCRYFGGECDGVDGVRSAARRLLSEGADFIKVMASGGGTVGTFSERPSYEVDELRAAVEEAHKAGKPCSCHTIATESISRALDAGTDHIEHCSFMAPDKSWQFDEAIARRVAESGVMVTPTLQVGFDRLEAAEAAGDHEAAEPHRRALADSLANARQLHELGVPLVAGNDAGWRQTGFDDFHKEIALLVEAGLSPLEAIHAATGRAAAACRVPEIGTLAPGQAADLIAVRGNPAEDIRLLADPVLVMLGGRIVVDRRA
jgi:imidazolonepropionase-like amidohydrolase